MKIKQLLRDDNGSANIQMMIIILLSFLAISGIIYGIVTGYEEFFKPGAEQTIIDSLN